MEYTIEEWVINDLLELYDAKELNLNPPYQRNDIWPPLSKKRLIESVKKGYPLPSFFIHKKKNGKFDMVDGQQRTRTFIGYKKEFFPDTEKKKFNPATDEKLYKQYRLCICILKTAEDDDGSIEDFYYRVNKFGIKLNRPEIKRAEFFDTEFQELIEEVADDPKFERLNLFTEKSMDRLNDLDFVAELLTLIKHGITDKKITVDRLYQDQTIKKSEIKELGKRFLSIIEKILPLNESYPLSETRYKQRNDFYTLFNFLLKNDDLSKELLKYQYKILVLIGGDIYPTNEKCWAFQEYANNCVSQSNSKHAREERLKFFERILLNKENDPFSKLIKGKETEFDAIADVISFYDLKKPLINIEGYSLINVEELNQKKPDIIFH